MPDEPPFSVSVLDNLKVIRSVLWAIAAILVVLLWAVLSR